jgi:hypothetical protein
LLPINGNRQVVAVFVFECGHLGRVLEPIFPVGPAHGIPFGWDSPVFSRISGILGIVFHRGWGHGVADIVGIEKLCQIDVMPGLGCSPQPLAVADDHIIGRALGVEFGKGLGLEI